MGLFKNQLGASLIQMIILGAITVGLGAVVMKTTQTQRKSGRSLSKKVEMSELTTNMKNVLASTDICRRTLADLGLPLSNEMIFPNGILNSTGGGIYRVIPPTILTDGSLADRAPYQYGNGMQITELKLIDYNSSPGLAFSRAALKVTLNKYVPNDKKRAFFGGDSKSEYIPLMLVTVDDVVQLCMSDEDDSGIQAFRDACVSFGGTFNEANGLCEGVADSMIQKVKENLCAAVGTESCVHPYRNLDCTNAGTDIRGVAHGNWVVDGFEANGDVKCTCVPRPCPSTQNACFGQDLGTDHCSQVCPVGTLKNDTCCNPWNPSPATVCSGFVFNQTNQCGDTRPNTGTNPIVWTPAQSTVCAGTNFTQTRTCDGTTRNQVGTQPIVWTPSPSTVCAGQNFTQTRTCDGSTRGAVGARDCTCYGGFYGAGCNWPNGTLGDSTSFPCGSGAVAGTCSATCGIEFGIVKWIGTNTCKFAWSVGSWGSCNAGTRSRSVSCPFPVSGCLGPRPPSTEPCS